MSQERKSSPAQVSDETSNEVEQGVSFDPPPDDSSEPDPAGPPYPQEGE